MTPAEIAARLTDAQRRALLWLPADGGWRTLFQPSRLRVSLWALYDRDLSATGQGWKATPLGQQVRAILAAEAQRDA